MPKKGDISPKKKILDTARELFYRQGFPTTGINQILDESGTFKASFYKYFSSKDDLGRMYLVERAEVFLAVLQRLMLKHDNIRKFARVWHALLVRDAKRPDFRGCAFVNFAAQTVEPGNKFKEELRDVTLRWIGILENYCLLQKERGYLPLETDEKKLAIKIIQRYEGAIQLFRMTGDISYLEGLETEFQDLFE